MSKTIDGVPEYLTREQFAQMFSQFGFDPHFIKEMRFAPDGVHAIVYDKDESGKRYLAERQGYAKSRVFIPVRKTDIPDERTTRRTKIA